MKKLLILILLIPSIAFSQKRQNGTYGNGGTPSWDNIVGKKNLNIAPVKRSGYDSLAYIPNDSTLKIKAISVVVPSGATVTPSSTDTTLTFTISGVATLTGAETISGNKRYVPRQDSTASTATPTINTDNVDIYKITALATNITSMTTNLTGTPRHGDILQVQFTGTATRTIAWGTAFVSSTVALPTTTSGTATLTVTLQYFTNSSYGNFKWVCTGYF